MAILDKSDIKAAFEAAQTYIKPYFEPLAEFERLARNKPHPSVLKAKMPSVTDGTLAAVIQAQPRRIIQQLPTGKVESADSQALGQLSNFIWTDGVLPNANTAGDPLQKWWIISAKSKTYGCQPIYSFFNNSGEYYGADFLPPYIKDVFPEPGKLNANDSEYVFMQSWWTKGQIKSVIEREKKLKRNASDRGEQYASGWNLTALASLLDSLEAKPDEAKTPEEKKDAETGYARLIHCFQRGIGAEFYTYSPRLNKVIRTKVNPDPRGCIPITYMYDTIDLSNPLGRGAAEMSGGMQNLLDSEVQSYQFMQKMGMAPPLKKWGSGIVNTSIKWKPFAVWDMGTDPNTKLDLVQLNTDAIRNFPQNYGLIKSQILNLTNNQDNSISSESGNPSQSKTQAGVKASESRVQTDDNYFRKQFESAFEAVAETMLNIHFAESSGTREIELTDDFLKKLPEGTQNEYFNITQTADGQSIATILYDQIKNKLKFQVDASTSKMQNDSEQLEALDGLLARLEKSQVLQGIIPPKKIVGAWNSVVAASGVEDPENLSVDEQELEEMQAQQQAQAEAQAAQAQAQAQMQPPGPPGAPQPGAPMPPDQQAGQPPQGGPEDAQLAQAFIDAGFPPEVAAQGVQLTNAGYDHDQVMQILTQAQQGVPA